MLTLADLRKQAERHYLRFVQQHLQGEGYTVFAAKAIKDSYDIENETELDRLFANEKVKKGYGYTIELKEKKGKKASKISRIFFETEDDFLLFLNKKAEFKHLNTIKKVAKKLELDENWWLKNWNLAIKYTIEDWDNLLKVADFFVANPRPNLYIRQLPIDVHTKFIEEHQGILKKILDALLPNDIRNENATKFEKRYYLDHEEPIVRIRFLDENTRIHPKLSNISILLSEAISLEINCENVLIVENKTNFLTFLNLPDIPKTIAIWGRGFAISELKNIDWLHQKRIFYWGDLDAQGFEILNSLKKYYPETTSILMDTTTLAKHTHYIKDGTPTNTNTVQYLNRAEKDLFLHLKTTNQRLEQEKIEFEYVVATIQQNLHTLALQL